MLNEQMRDNQNNVIIEDYTKKRNCAVENNRHLQKISYYQKPIVRMVLPSFLKFVTQYSFSIKT